MKAIIYTSNTGSTKRYAKLLEKELNISAYSAEEAKKAVPIDSDVLYLGWIMAGSIKGYAAAAKRYHVLAVCAVGMGQTGGQIAEVRMKNKIPEHIPVFTLQGNFQIRKLHGVYRLMMNVMVKTAGKALAEKTDRTPEEEDMLDMMLHEGERVRAENLSSVLEWISAMGETEE